MGKTKSATTSPMGDTWNGYYERVNAGQATPADLLTWFDWTIAERASIEAELGTLTVAELKRRFHSYSAKSKAEWVHTGFSSMSRAFLLKNLCYSMDEDVTTVTRRLIAETTPKEIADHAAAIAESRAKRAARVEQVRAALANPQTLSDFEDVQNFREGGLAKLTVGERARLDALRWERDRAQANSQLDLATRIEAVDLVDVEVILHKTVHTTKEVDLYVVTLSDWVEQVDFEDLCEAAKDLGGYYSTYRAPGAIPGFTFRQEAQARLFMDVFEVDVSTQEVRAERRRVAQLIAKERLVAIAAGMVDRADEVLSADRKVNTERRARMAQNVTTRCFAEQAMARTLVAIAGTMGTGEHVLDGIRHRTHAEALERLAQRATYRMTEGQPVDELLHVVSLPQLSLSRENAIWCHKALESERNTVRVCDHLRKRIAAGEETLVFTDRIERDYAVRILQKLGKRCPWYLAEALRERRRLDRMGIRTSADLRHALRTYWKLRSPPEGIPERTRLVHSLIGRPIPGFFPTPEGLVDHLLDLADIPEGATVIEPSAGKGDIADRIRERHPEVLLTCIELNSTLASILRLEHDQVVQADWLDQRMMADRIVMNPPFEEDQDILHIHHAFTRLNPGGRLVAIASRGAVQRTTARAQDFQRWLEATGAEVTLNPDGSFLGAFRSTGVATVTIVIDKPAAGSQQAVA